VPRTLITSLFAVVLLCACGGGARTAAPAPSGSPRTGCVSQAEATRIWKDLDRKLNALENDPRNAKVEAVATGQAADLIKQYLQEQLIAHGFTEREVDKLRSLTVLEAGCDGGRLQVQVTETVVQDDYVKPNGQLDHSDALVGKTINVVQTFVRSGAGWKESDFADLDQGTPSPTPQLF
jgi:hypothetical protein